MILKHVTTRRGLAWLLAGTVGAAALAAPAAAQTSSPQPSPLRAERNAQAVAAIAPTFKFVKDDAFTVGIHVGSPPLGSYAADAKTIVGFNPDIARLIADALGRRLVLVPVAWADWPLGLSSGKFDAVISNVTVTEARKEKFDFSTYRQDLLGFYVKAGSPIRSLAKPEDVAGLKVITDPGTNQEQILVNWDRQNRAAGRKPVEIQYYDDDAVKTLALQSGRADAIFSVNSTLAYKANVAKSGTQQAGTLNGGWPLNADIAVATRKDAGLAEALTVAINGLIAQGQYREVLQRWSLESEAIERSLTNPPGLPKS